MTLYLTLARNNRCEICKYVVIPEGLYVFLKWKLVNICLCGLSKTPVLFTAQFGYLQGIVTSQKCALIYDGTAHVCNIQNMNTEVIVEYPVKSW